MLLAACSSSSDDDDDDDWVVYKSFKVEEADGTVDAYSTSLHERNIIGDYLLFEGFFAGAEAKFIRYDNESFTGEYPGKITRIDESSKRIYGYGQHVNGSTVDVWWLYNDDKSEIRGILSDGGYTVYKPYTGTIPAPVQ